jgi:hypothetical protein
LGSVDAPAPDTNASCSGSFCPTYTATLIESAVTPGDVAPPLSVSSHGSTQGAALFDRIFTRPRSVSQFGPKSMSSPSASASAKVTGRSLAGDEVPSVSTSASSSPPPLAIRAMIATTAMITTNGP